MYLPSNSREALGVVRALALRRHLRGARFVFFGERDRPTIRGAILDLGAELPDLGTLARGVARGIARNFHSRRPADALQDRRRVVGRSNALRRNPLLRTKIRGEIGLPRTMTRTEEESATGAVLVACRLAGTASCSLKALHKAIPH